MRNITISMLKRVKYALLIFVLFGFNSDSPKSAYTIPIRVSSVTCADIDLDGYVDILVGHLTGYQDTNVSFTILKNDGSGNFVIADTSKSFCGYQKNIFACKIDEDDYPDLVTLYADCQSGVAEEYIRIWYNENGNFNTYKDFSLNNTGRVDYVIYGDVNGDGLIDILVMSNRDRRWSVLYNLGNGLLSLPEYYNLDYPPVDIQCGDLNGDNRDDVVIFGTSLEIYYSRASGFERKVLDASAFKNMGDIADFDLDGLVDIVGIGVAFNKKWVNIYRNTGNEIFIKLDNHITSPFGRPFSINDYNNDGLPDIAYLTIFPLIEEGLVDTVGGVEIFYNLGNFQLSEPYFFRLDNLGELGRIFCTADFDENGYNDFAIVRIMYVHLENNLELFFNDGNGNFLDNPVGISEYSQKRETAKLRCFPNPFIEYINFEYKIEKTAMVELNVYDMQGKFIQCLTHQIKEGGVHTIQWNGLANSLISEKPSILIACLKVNGEICKAIKIIKK
ncbi:MAG TPA: VCBS repeat-containing protein [Salinivirgaceae bacterium]|nr:VCBS repeat-containing protein [Salinivirgaceae bacterium]HQA75916.1 VCBS repeat-containing protein [Salinivirgaceae bacterium]